MHKPAAPHIFGIAKLLKKEYKDFAHNNKKNPLDELVFILCSVKRSEQIYLNAFRTLKQAFPKYEMLADTPVREIRKAVAWGGLQNQKTSAVKTIIKTLIKKFGKPTLAPLKKMSDEKCERFLLSFPGVGKKVARCVMLYSLERQVFPVDSHCWRIANRLGWNKKTHLSKHCSDKDMDFLQELIPPRIRFSLHVNMVSHGRKTCTARFPRCNACTISRYCLQMGM
ncbi:MAG: endonuclease III [Nitrospirae bacterium]|nr:endonuclease III [Nitrospirota bacterium]